MGVRGYEKPWFPGVPIEMEPPPPQIENEKI